MYKKNAYMCKLLTCTSTYNVHWKFCEFDVPGTQNKKGNNNNTDKLVWIIWKKNPCLNWWAFFTV